MKFLRPEQERKWGPILDSKEFLPIPNKYKRAVTAVVLEQSEKTFMTEGGGVVKFSSKEVNNGTTFRQVMKEHEEYSKKQTLLKEAAAANSSGAYPAESGLTGPEPVLIPLLRQAIPQMIAFDVIGVQPLQASVGLIFAMRSHATSRAGAEILFPEADTRFTTDQPAASGAGFTATNPATQVDLDAYKPYPAMTTATGEALGTGGNPTFSEIAFTIDKVEVSAKTRAIQAKYTNELQQDMQTGHGIDARAILMEIMVQELLFEQNREVIRLLHNNAKAGAQNNTQTAGIFDLDVDSDGRWMEERFKGLQFQIEREANSIMLDARRGRGNFIICSADVASALSVTKLLDSDAAAKELQQYGEVQGSSYVGTLNGRFKVYVDPYIPVSSTNYFLVGYKGVSAWDAALYFCPYVPLQMMEAVDPSDFQPRIAYKSRYGIVSNPYANSAGTGALTWNANKYLRRVRVDNLM